jgi:hypothetical protein
MYRWLGRRCICCGEKINILEESYEDRGPPQIHDWLERNPPVERLNRALASLQDLLRDVHKVVERGGLDADACGVLAALFDSYCSEYRRFKCTLRRMTPGCEKDRLEVHRQGLIPRWVDLEDIKRHVARILFRERQSV